MRKSEIVKELVRNKSLYIMGVPALIYFVVFCYLPMAGIVIAFKDYNVVDGIFGSRFIGLKNFDFLFKSRDALRITFNTLRLNFFFIVSGVISQVGIAILLNEIKNKMMKKLYQSIIFAPYFISWVIVGAFAYNIFAKDIGILNSLRASIGLDPIEWYAKANYWPFILTGTYIWKWMGYGTIIYLSAISSIDQSIYESGSIDGCNKWQLIRYITIPMLIPTIITMVLLAVGRIFYGDFGMVFNMVRNNPMLYKTVDVIDTYVYRAFQGRGGNFAMGSAAGVFQSVMGFMVILTTNGVIRRYSKENALF